MVQTTKKFGMGWKRDLPDFRDYTPDHDAISQTHKALGQKSIKEMVAKVGVDRPYKSSEDLRAWCSPIENQGPIGSCTACACVGLVEYFEIRTSQHHIDASRLFLYKATRNLMGETGDSGAYIRTTMGALTLFGVPPEEYWPYIYQDYNDNEPFYDKEPTAFCYAYAQNYQALSYYRLDPPGISRDELLETIKAYLRAGLPSMFGFTVYPSFNQAETNGGKIPFPAEHEGSPAGHAIVAVGYDDDMVILNTLDGLTTTGALLIRNSWGENWGDGGYGWLPYEYVLWGLADDFWSILKNEWVDTDAFTMSTPRVARRCRRCR